MWDEPGHNQHILNAHLWYVCGCVEGDGRPFKVENKYLKLDEFTWDYVKKRKLSDI